jgi:hypothetical protein
MTNQPVQEVVEHLRQEFPDSTVTFTPDGGGGGAVVVEPVHIPNCSPSFTWIGANLSPLVPFADIYPLFIGPDVKRLNGTPLPTPVSVSQFAGHPALQVSRATRTLVATPHAAALKFRKVLDFVKELAV